MNCQKFDSSTSKTGQQTKKKMANCLCVWLLHTGLAFGQGFADFQQHYSKERA